MRALPLALVLVAVATAPVLAESRPVTVETIARTAKTASGKPIAVPEHPEVVVSTYEIAAHQRLPLHKHPYARYAYVLDGSLTVEVRGLRDRITHNMNVSGAEVGKQDFWKTAALSFVTVAAQKATVEKRLSEVAKILESDPRYVLMQIHTEYL